MLPEKIKKFLLESEKFIDRDGELKSHRRLGIQELIEELSLVEHVKAGYYRRAKLSMNCAHHSFDFFLCYPSVKQLAERTLAKAQLAIKGQYSMTDLEVDNRMLFSRTSELFENDKPDFCSIYSSFSCHASVNTVLYDIDFDSLAIDEIERDPVDWESSFYGCLSYCGGATWESTGNAIKRREYWLWYLRDAIPALWDN